MRLATIWASCSKLSTLKFERVDMISAKTQSGQSPSPQNRNLSTASTRMLPTWRLLLLLGICRQLYALPAHTSVDLELNTCELQLAKYRKFILQAILSFEDVCDAYNARPVPPEDAPLSETWLFHQYAPPPTSQRGEIWAFFKLLMAQFNDVEFATIIRDAVIERCRFKLQRDDKRNSVVLGKKQRFHSWGGKRSPDQTGGGPLISLPEAVSGVAGTGMEHNYY